MSPFKMSSYLDLTVIGDAFIDILVPIKDIALDGVTERKIYMKPGGLANTAVWASRLNSNVAFIGMIGTDVFGRFYYEDLVKEGVLPLLSYSRKPTGKCILLLDGEERTMIVDRGANDEFKEEDVPDKVLAKTKYTYFSGYSWASENLKHRMNNVMKEAKSASSIVVFNAGSYNIIKKNLAYFKKVIAENVDILVMNEGEAKALTGRTDLPKIISVLKDAGPKFILTLGKKGSIAFDGKCMIESKIKTVSNVVDITGAGDAFMGGFLAGLSNNRTFEKSVLNGHAIAEKVVTRIGAR